MHNQSGYIALPDLKQEADVAAVLGAPADANGRHLLFSLCTSPLINKFSKVKPVGNETFGLNVVRQEWASGVETFYKSGNNWIYVPSDNSPRYPHHLLAFNGYLHTAGALCSVSCPSLYYIEETNQVLVYATFNSDRAYAVNILDFQDFVYYQSIEMFFGVIVKTTSPTAPWSILLNPNPIGTSVSQTTTENGAWGRGVFIGSDELPTIDGSTAEIYPIVTANHQYNNKKSPDFGLYCITLPTSYFTVTADSMASYLSGALSGISITRSVGAYYVTFTYAVTNSHPSRDYSYLAQTATLYVCSTVQDPTGYQGYHVLCQFSGTIGGFSVSRGQTASRTITQLWSNVNNITDPLVIACADTSTNDVKLYLEMPKDCGNAGFYSYTLVSGVSLNKSTTTLNPGQTETLTATVSPNNATNKNVSWSTSNYNVATVSNGVITAVANGTAVITVTTQSGGYTATCSVTVRTPVSGVSLSQGNISLNLNDVYTNGVSATVSPSTASNKGIIWTCGSGIVLYSDAACTTQAPVGTATTTVYTVYPKAVSNSSTSYSTWFTATSDENGDLSSTCNVSVNVPIPDTHSMTLSPSGSTDITEGNRVLFTADPKTNGNTQSDCTTWSKSGNIELYASSSAVNPINTNNYHGNTVYVNAGAYSSGTTGTVTATHRYSTENASCTVHIQQQTVAVTGISLDKETLSLSVGQSTTLKATISPSNATNKTVNWTRQNTNVTLSANTSQSGNNISVSANSAGTCNVTATADGNSGKYKVCVVTITAETVKIYYEGDDYTGATINVNEGESIQLTANYSGTATSYLWTSSNNSYVTITNNNSATCTVNAVGRGTPNPTVTLKINNDSNLTATVRIHVTNPQ